MNNLYLSTRSCDCHKYYGNEFEIRYSNDSNASTEFEKIMFGKIMKEMPKFDILREVAD